MFNLLYQDIHKVSHTCQGWNCDFDLVSWKCIFAEERRGVAHSLDLKHTGFSVPCESLDNVVIEVPSSYSVIGVREILPVIESVSPVESFVTLPIEDTQVEDGLNIESFNFELCECENFTKELDCGNVVMNGIGMTSVSVGDEYVRHQVHVMRECGMLACAKDPDKDSDYKRLFHRSDRKETYIDVDSDSCDDYHENKVDTREIELELNSLLSRLNEKKNEALLLSKKNSEMTVELIRFRKLLFKSQSKCDKLRIQGQNAYYENCELRKSLEETRSEREEYLCQLTQMKRLVESNMDFGHRIQTNLSVDQSLAKWSRNDFVPKYHVDKASLVESQKIKNIVVPKLVSTDIDSQLCSQTYYSGRKEFFSLMNYKKGDDIRFATVAFSVFGTNREIRQVGIEYVGRSGKSYSRVYFIVSDRDSQGERDRIQKMKMHCHYDKDIRLIRTMELVSLFHSFEKQVGAYLCYLEEDVVLLRSFGIGKDFPIFNVRVMSCLLYPSIDDVPILANVVRMLAIPVLEYSNAGNYACIVAKVYAQIYFRFSEDFMRIK